MVSVSQNLLRLASPFYARLVLASSHALTHTLSRFVLLVLHHHLHLPSTHHHPTHITLLFSSFPQILRTRQTLVERRRRKGVLCSSAAHIAAIYQTASLEWRKRLIRYLTNSAPTSNDSGSRQSTTRYQLSGSNTLHLQLVPDGQHRTAHCNY